MIVEGPKTPGGPVSRETQARDVAVDGREPVCRSAPFAHYWTSEDRPVPFLAGILPLAQRNEASFHVKHRARRSEGRRNPNSKRPHTLGSNGSSGP